MKKIISAVLVLTMMLALLSGCGDNSASENNVETSDLYEQVMARFDGELEEGAVIKVLENDTAVELGYVDQLINAFNEAYKDKGISAERMNIDQYSDLATDGPYGYGPDVWYQANDILMKYADNQHLLPLPIYDMECYEQIPQNAWNAYATDINGETFYCGIPLNVQSGMLYYIESMLPENWETEWDINSNGTPDFFETYTALYAYSELCKEGGEKTKYLEDIGLDIVIMAPDMLKVLEPIPPWQKLTIYTVREEWAFGGDYGEDFSLTTAPGMAKYILTELVTEQLESGYASEWADRPDWGVECTPRSYECGLHDSYCENHYKVCIEEQELPIDDDAVRSLLDNRLRRYFAEQIEGWDGLEGLTEQQIADTIAAPNVPRHIRRQLEQDGFLMDSFWKSVSKASFDLVRQYKEKLV